MTATLEPSPLPELSSLASAAAGIVGRTAPRIFTPPLVAGPPGPCGCGCALTPETSYGFDVVIFARDVLGEPLDPWERWAVIHGGELLPDGRPRFRKLLIIVARQNGKTHLLVVLTLFWLYVDRVALVLGTSTKLDYAAESWRKACRLARRVPELRAEIPKGGVRKANGEQMLWRADPEEELFDDGSRYKIAASNEEGGRSLTIGRLVLDELRQHHDYSAHDASVPATNAVPDAQIWALSNMGDDRSVVLLDWRKAAISYIDTGAGDTRLGLFEYSAPKNASPLDIDALAQANPNLGIRVDAEALLSDALTAVRVGGEKLAGFKTENMCIRVRQLDPAVNIERWRAPYPDGCLDPAPLDGVRVALVADVAIDGLHATLYAAGAQPDGRVRVDPVAAWTGPTAARELARDLPGHVAETDAAAFGWFPNGPAAGVAADLTKRAGKGRLTWPPPGVTVEEIKSETTAVCMALADLIEAGQIAQSGDPLLDAQLEAAERLWQGDAWRFVRRGAGHVDAAYAAAGAVHLARTLPPPPEKPKLIVPQHAQHEPAQES